MDLNPASYRWSLRVTGSSNLAPNGQVGGKQYFACKPGHGILLRADDVHLVSKEEEEQLEAAHRSSESHFFLGGGGG